MDPASHHLDNQIFPFLGGALYQWGGYQVPFIVLGSVLIMAGAFTYFGLPTQDNEAETDDNQASTLCSKGLKIIKKVQKPVSISPTFYEQLLRQNPFAKKLQTQIVSTEKLHKKLSYEKAARYW